MIKASLSLMTSCPVCFFKNKKIPDDLSTCTCNLCVMLPPPPHIIILYIPLCPFISCFSHLCIIHCHHFLTVLKLSFWWSFHAWLILRTDAFHQAQKRDFVAERLIRNNNGMINDARERLGRRLPPFPSRILKQTSHALGSRVLRFDKTSCIYSTCF